MFVFPMAGQSSRFTKAGFTKPKFMLHAGDRTIFEHAIGGFRRYFDSEDFAFIYVEGQADPEFIIDACERQGLMRQRVRTIGLPAPTDGQATTVVEGLRQIGLCRAEPLTIFNIDTFYADFVQPDFVGGSGTDGSLDVFVAEGEHWSFVEPADRNDTEGLARRVAEKVRISVLIAQPC